MSRALYQAALEWLGTPFAWAGREKGIGCDCVGLILGPAAEIGLTHWDTRGYSPQIDSGYLRQCLERFCDKVSVEEMRAGDILLFVVRQHAQHLGIADGEGGFLHAHQSVGRVVAQTLDRWWAGRIAGCYRWREA